MEEGQQPEKEKVDNKRITSFDYALENPNLANLVH